MTERFAAPASGWYRAVLGGPLPGLPEGSTRVLADDEWVIEPVPEDAPLFPESAGRMLHALLNPTPEPGPPFVHTFRGAPDCDRDDCCETDQPCPCACHRVQPTFTMEPADG